METHNSKKSWSSCLSGDLLKTTILSSMLSGMALGLAMPAMAQTADADAEDEQKVLDTIVVTGIRGSLAEALDIKREASTFVDAITALDIGKFPDKNVADALQRVPGVAITRSGGEGQFVSIRGTGPDLALTQLNGNYIATASTNRDPERSFNFALLPANLIAKTEVFKTPQAKLDEGGVGGTIIVHTRRPLDEEAGAGFLSAEGTYSDVTEEWEPNLAGMYSWKNEAETIGLLVSVTNQERTSVTEAVGTEGWRNWNSAMVGMPFTEESLFDTAGNEIIGYAPFAVTQTQNLEDRKRFGVQVTGQWAPTDRLLATFNYLGATFEQNNDGNLFLLAEWDYRDPSIVPGSVRMNGDTIVAMQFADVDLTDDVDLQAPAIGSRRSLSEADSNTYDFELAYDSNSLDVVFKIGHTESSGGSSFNALQRFNSPGGVTAGYGWDLEAGTVINGDAEVEDFTGFGWRSSDAGQSSDEEFYAQADVSWYTDWGIFTSIDFGAKYRDHEIGRRLVNMIWDDGDPNNADLWGGCCGLGYEYWHTSSQVPTAEEIPGFLQTVSGLTGRAGTQKSFLTLNWDAYRGWLDDNFTRFTREEDSFFFNINEVITAAYVQGNFAAGGFSGNVGLRVVNTDQDTETFNSLNGVRDDILDTQSGSNTELLPSLNVKYDVSDDIVLRAAASRVFARVPYTLLGESESFSANELSVEGTGSRGNPDLQPFDANQYDVGVEWYFDEASIFGATLFHKDIKTLWASDQVYEDREFAGRVLPVLFSQPVNGNDATSTGVEVFFQHQFDWGGGLTANYTYTDTSASTITSDGETIEAPIPGTSENMFNISLFYENEKLGARASYNYRDESPNRRDTGLDVFDDAYGQVDANIYYNITDAISLNASVINLTQEDSSQYLGQENRVYGRQYTGRRFYVGVNYNF